MRQRFSSHTTLIELSAALLVFMLASVTILGLFTTAFDFSREAKVLTRAMIAAQDCAAIIAASLEPEAALLETGYRKGDEGSMVRQLDEETRIAVEWQNEQTPVGEMLNGQIRVYTGEIQVLEMPVCRYYNKEVIHP